MAATTVEAPESAGLDGNATSWAGMAFIAIVCVMTVAISAVAHAGAHAVLVGLVLGWALAAVPALGGAPVPEWLAALAFLLLGAGIGLRFTGDVAKQILRLMPLALLVLVLVLMSCAASGALLSLWTGKSWMDGYLATTPGGVPAVLAAGAATSADITFVSAAQIFRLLMVLGFAPLLVKLIMRAR